MRRIGQGLKPNLKLIEPHPEAELKPTSLGKILDHLGVCRTSADNFASSLPFSLDDTTVGIENELQTAVIGSQASVDLPLIIKESNYYKNILKNTTSGNTSRELINALEEYLGENGDGVWENSWVRLPRAKLCRYALQILQNDLQADKTKAKGPCRKDVCRYSFKKSGQTYVRIPVSYLLKLALADVIGKSGVPPLVKRTGARIMDHFSNDNTSPEVFSFYPTPMNGNASEVQAAANETAKRFLFCQFLLAYSNLKFDLQANNQNVEIYFSPQPPLRQKMLNNIISDAFYRELFMSPCLSGWPQGEAKHRYMVLCHQVLSRSQLNALKKLKEANIITHNLVVLPNISNTSLANNGTHVSLGSLKLTRCLSDPKSGFKAEDEKYLGDLTIKIVEHFLPLYVGSYTAAPYRFDFHDFHPEKALGFLPHELDYTHLRMIWRRWKKKANLSFLGHSFTPFGPVWLDNLISKTLRLKGDFIFDFRLIDYLISLLSTDQSPALDGRMDNDKRLKEDLAALGVFDTSMPLYCLYRLRQQKLMGYSGFEGRHYSLFYSLTHDLGEAIRLQTLLTALAFKYIMSGEVHHLHIPDDPSIESERRQIFFGTAIGIPTFFIRKNTKNHFMQKILKAIKKTRFSRRYAGYIRVSNIEYRKALIEILLQDAADLIEILGMQNTVRDLNLRIAEAENYSAQAKLTKGILEKAGAKSPMALAGSEFNCLAERYYREDLKARHIDEGLVIWHRDLLRIDSWESWRSGAYNSALLSILKGRDATEYLRLCRDKVRKAESSLEELTTLIHLMLLTIHQNMETAARSTSAKG